MRDLTWQKAGTVFYYGLVPFALTGVWLLRRRRTMLLPLMAPVAMVTLSSVLSYGLQRFRFAAEVALVVLAAVAIVALAEHLAERRRSRGGAVSARRVGHA